MEKEASYFRGKDYYLDSWLLFKPTFSSFTRGTYIEKWKSKDSNDDSDVVAVKTTSNNTPKIVIYINYIYIRNKVINVYIVYKLTPRIITEDELVQVNELFGNLKKDYRYIITL